MIPAAANVSHISGNFSVLRKTVESCTPSSFATTVCVVLLSA
ncbi:hypothetical protein CSB69_4046 [Morganella morganii]|nr:hypothetical protein CSB69_4046 [Morganella morganii]EMP51311.1 hypothetical protein C790_01226 [Morganella morganii SC01]